MAEGDGKSVNPHDLSALKIDVELSRIDGGTTWASAYWGYNAPKLVYDGDSFYTVGYWGEEQATRSLRQKLSGGTCHGRGCRTQERRRRLAHQPVA